MEWIPKVVSILIVIDALTILFKPAMLKKYCQLFSEGVMIYVAAILYALVGLAFLFGVSEQCNLPAVITAFGILFIAAAVFILAAPSRARRIAAFFAVKTPVLLRFYAVLYLLIGAFLVYSS